MNNICLPGFSNAKHLEDVKSLFRYPGGKYKMRKQIASRCLSEFHDSDTYVEPFFGAGGFGLCWIASNVIQHCILNDADATIVSVWRSVERLSNLLKSRIQNFNIELYESDTARFYNLQEELRSVQDVPPDDNMMVDIALKKIAIHQMSYSGLGTKAGGPIGGKNKKSSYRISCRWNPDSLCEKIDKAHDVLQKVPDLEITHRDFLEILSMTNGCVYVDPPYYEVGNTLYSLGFNEDQHQQLHSSLLALRERGGHWVLSYNDHQKVRDLYKDSILLAVNDVRYSITAHNAKSELLISCCH